MKMFHISGVSQNKDSVAIMERIPLGELKHIGNWSRKSIDFPMEYGFNAPVPVEFDPPVRLATGSLKMDKNNQRNNIFSEFHCHWKVPLDETNMISDGIRVNDDLVMSSVNPPMIYHCKDFMNSNEVNFIHNHLSAGI